MNGHTDSSGRFRPHGNNIRIRKKAGSCVDCGRPVMFASHKRCINCMNKHNDSLPHEGKWFKGNVFKGNFKSDDLEKKMKTHGSKVKAPHALRTKTIKGVEHSQFYHKPIQRGEFSD